MLSLLVVFGFQSQTSTQPGGEALCAVMQQAVQALTLFSTRDKLHSFLASSTSSRIQTHKMSASHDLTSTQGCLSKDMLGAMCATPTSPNSMFGRVGCPGNRGQRKGNALLGPIQPPPRHHLKAPPTIDRRCTSEECGGAVHPGGPRTPKWCASSPSSTAI